MKKIINFLRRTLLFSLTITAGLNIATANENVAVNTKNADKEAHKNIQFLLGNVLQKSKKLQEDFGDFSPYGAALFIDGSVKYVWYARPGETVNNPTQSLTLIREALQTQAQSGKIIGSAIIYKFKKQGQDQVQLTVELEYQSGLALAFSTEMKIDSNNSIDWGNNSKVNFEPRIFVPQTTKDKSKQAN